MRLPLNPIRRIIKDTPECTTTSKDLPLLLSKAAVRSSRHASPQTYALCFMNACSRQEGRVATGAFQALSKSFSSSFPLLNSSYLYTPHASSPSVQLSVFLGGETYFADPCSLSQSHPYFYSYFSDSPHSCLPSTFIVTYYPRDLDVPCLSLLVPQDLFITGLVQSAHECAPNFQTTLRYDDLANAVAADHRYFFLGGKQGLFHLVIYFYCGSTPPPSLHTFPPHHLSIALQNSFPNDSGTAISKRRWRNSGAS